MASWSPRRHEKDLVDDWRRLYPRQQ